MNAPIRAPRPDGAVAGVRRHPFTMLLRREYWEHRGGFFWAPVIAGAISLLLTAVFAVIGLVAAHQAGRDGRFVIDGVSINGFDLGMIGGQLSASDLRQIGNALDVSLLMASSWPFIVMAFVVFFYCLGALYDDRRDRSVLFWKSLPVSDRDTVLSKVVSAILVAPILATAAALVTMLLFLLGLTVLVVAHGGNAWQLLWSAGSPFQLALYFVAMIPIFAVWALPTVGWLLMCSAWARSKPFLWAVLIPVMLGICVWWFDVMGYFDLQASWFWQHVVARLLLGVAPVAWIDALDLQSLSSSGQLQFDGTQHLRDIPGLAVLYSSFLSLKMWIGAVAGAVMITLAIWLRRWREEV